MRAPEGGSSWYEEELARRAPSRGEVAGGQDAKHDLALTPGMPVEAHIRTAERTLISYPAKPVTDFCLRGPREE